MRYALNIVVNRPLFFFFDTQQRATAIPLHDNNDYFYDLTLSPAFPLLIAFKDSHYVAVMRESLLFSTVRKPAYDAMSGACAKLTLGPIKTYGMSTIDQLVEIDESDIGDEDTHDMKVKRFVSHLTLEPTTEQVIEAAKESRGYLINLINEVTAQIYLLFKFVLTTHNKNALYLN